MCMHYASCVHALQASTLLSYAEWIRMMKDFALLDGEFTVREATLAFLRLDGENWRIENLLAEDMMPLLQLMDPILAA